jgi:predicted TPR repeat methyltransferase
VRAKEPAQGVLVGLLFHPGRVAELADAQASGACVRKDVGVQVPPRPLVTLDPDDYLALNEAQTISEVDSFTPHRYAQFARHLRDLGSAPRILDVGCNTGRGGRVLRTALPSAHLEGLELVPGRAERVADVYDAVTVGDLATLVVPEPRFDALVMGELIEHVPYTALEQLLASTAALLVPGGRVLLTTPNPHAVRLRMRRGTVLGGSHVSVHCPAALSELMNHRGFRVVRVEGSGRALRIVGVRFPLSLYGSYLLIAERRADT